MLPMLIHDRCRRVSGVPPNSSFMASSRIISRPKVMSSMILLGAAVERAQQRRLDHGADRRDGERADRQQQQLSGQAEVAADVAPNAPPTSPGRDVGAERIEACRAPG